MKKIEEKKVKEIMTFRRRGGKMEKKKARFLIADHERGGLAGFSILLHFDNIFQIVVVKKRTSA